MPKRISASFEVRNLICALLFLLLTAPAAAQTIPSGPFGSLNYWGVGGLSTVLNPGLAGQCLTTQGVGSAPVWVNCQVSQLSLLPPINTNQFYCNTSGNFAPPLGCDVNAILNTVGYDIARPPTVESILYKSNVGPSFNWQTLPPSTPGSVLTSGGPTNPPFWATNPIQANLSGICTTVGAVLYFDTPSLQWKCLSPGTSGQLLQSGGAAGNPSWLTRNVNTSSPLSGGGALTSDLSLTCPTCATTTNGGALSATAPIVLSAAGNVSMANQGTTTTVLHGNAAGNPTFSAVVISTDVSGLGTGIATALGVNVGSAGAPVLFNGAGGVPSSITLTNGTGLPTTGLTGTLQAAQEPAHTGDCTNSAGSLALTCLKTNGVAFTAAATAAAGQLPGTATNDSASAGNVGEYIESVIVSGSAISLTNATPKTITSISLTAGDWDVDCSLYFLINGASTAITAGMSLVTNTLDTTPGRWGQQVFNLTGPPTINANVPDYRFSFSTTTTVFLIAQNNFTTSTSSAYGLIRARRVR